MRDYRHTWLKKGYLSFVLAAVVMAILLGGCTTIDTGRIPSYPVYLNLSPLPVWEKYGVSGFSDTRIFIKESRIPSDFAWTERDRTGYGGLLIVSGVDPFTTEACVPIAYDLSCPVEHSRDIRVEMVAADPLPIARCPVCKSEYDVIEGGGRPISGKAADHGYGLKMYRCLPSADASGGYLLTN